MYKLQCSFLEISTWIKESGGAGCWCTLLTPSNRDTSGICWREYRLYYNNRSREQWEVCGLNYTVSRDRWTVCGSYYTLYMGTGAHYVAYLTVKSSQMTSDFSLVYTCVAPVHLRDSALVVEWSFLCDFIYHHTDILEENSHSPLHSNVIAKTCLPYFSAHSHPGGL